jgi:hypothetical protein
MHPLFGTSHHVLHDNRKFVLCVEHTSRIKMRVWFVWWFRKVHLCKAVLLDFAYITGVFNGFADKGLVFSYLPYRLQRH